MKGKTRKGGTADVAKLDANSLAWLALAPVLAAAGRLAEAVERFRDNPDAAALLADDLVADELNQFDATVPGIAAALSALAADVVAG